MTRIVSGAWSGRRLAVPRDRRLRPTAERVREAWLNVLGPALADAAVLDLFAGTGALGLEALSRGARHATFVDVHGESLDTLRQNIQALGAGPQSTVCRDDVPRFIAALGSLEFDVALADPPFASELAQQIATAWQTRPFARILAVEHPRQLVLDGGQARRWGDISVTFFQAA